LSSFYYIFPIVIFKKALKYFCINLDISEMQILSLQNSSLLAYPIFFMTYDILSRTDAILTHLLKFYQRTCNSLVL
jgi:hypothetical protein